MVILDLNALQQLDGDMKDAVVNWLGNQYDALTAEYVRDQDPNLMMGLDIILEMLQREGHIGS